MIEKIICLLKGHKWNFYPENTFPHDYKVCDRCNKSITLSPYLTRGEMEYIDRMFVEALTADLIARNSEFSSKSDNVSEAEINCLQPTNGSEEDEV